ncbi:MAG: retropepsin-like aspartic protease [Candidatus Eiseniibacteriota bacterium]
MPLTREKSHHITVEARLDGRPARFIIDTGAGGTIVDSSAAAEYKLKLRLRSKKGGGVGSTSMPMGSVAKHDLRLAGIDLSNTKLLTIDLSHVNAGLKKAKVNPVVGVIGADVLWRHHAVIDYGKGLMLVSQERSHSMKRPNPRIQRTGSAGR